MHGSMERCCPQRHLRSNVGGSHFLFSIRFAHRLHPSPITQVRYGRIVVQRCPQDATVRVSFA